MPGLEDHYQVLGVGPEATLEEIRRAYRAKAKDYHPDRLAEVPDPVRRLAEEKLKEVNAAYEVLRDAQKRREYDAKRRSRNSPSAPTVGTSTPNSSSPPYPRPGKSPSGSRLPALAFWAIVAVAIPVLAVVASRLSSSPLPPESLLADVPTVALQPTQTPAPLPTFIPRPTPTFAPFSTSTPRPAPTFTPLPAPTTVPLPSGVSVEKEHLNLWHSFNYWEEINSSTECYWSPCFRSRGARSVMSFFINPSIPTDPLYKAGQPEGEIISFYLRLPSGQLEFKMEGNTVAAWSGTPGWLRVECELRPGTNYYIEWDYSGDGRAWLDNIQLLKGTKQPEPSCRQSGH